VDNVYLMAAGWMAIALAASLVSIRLGVSVALIEIGFGVIAGNFGGLHTSPWIDFLATFGSGLLTFLAGAEIDPESLRRHLKMSLTIGVVSFAAPFVCAFAFAYYVAGWDLHAAEIAGIALSTTSVAVVYAVMVESGLAEVELGKTILAACFVTDLGTVLALGVLFASFSPLLLLFMVVTAVSLWFLPAGCAGSSGPSRTEFPSPRSSSSSLCSFCSVDWRPKPEARRSCRPISSVWR